MSNFKLALLIVGLMVGIFMIKNEWSGQKQKVEHLMWVADTGQVYMDLITKIDSIHYASAMREIDIVKMENFYMKKEITALTILTHDLQAIISRIDTSSIYGAKTK